MQMMSARGPVALVSCNVSGIHVMRSSPSCFSGQTGSAGGAVHAGGRGGRCIVSDEQYAALATLFLLKGSATWEFAGLMCAHGIATLSFYSSISAASGLSGESNCSVASACLDVSVAQKHVCTLLGVASLWGSISFGMGAAHGLSACIDSFPSKDAHI